MHGDEELLTFQRFMLAFDTPAYLRRARQVEGEWRHLVAVCERERQRLLELPRLRLTQLFAAADAVRHPEQLPFEAGLRQTLLELYRGWNCTLRTNVAVARRPADLQLYVRRLAEAFARFNQQFAAYLAAVDLGPVNRLRDGYNRFYLIEKECAVRSVQTARQGYEPLPPATLDDLRRLFPPLPEIPVED